MIEPHPYDVKRVQFAVYKHAHRKQVAQEDADRATEVFPKVVAQCGHFSFNRRMARKIGIALTHKSPVVYCPLCLSYGNLRNAVACVQSLLTRHIEFLANIATLVSGLRPVFLVPDLEPENNDICRLSGIKKEQFVEIMEDVARMVNSMVANVGWEAQRMSILFPDMSKEEVKVARWLMSESHALAKLEAQADERSSMYQKIDRLMRMDDMILRTAQTASQYIVLGNYAEQAHALICNHSTTSLRWYMKTDAAILHNPITLQ